MTDRETRTVPARSRGLAVALLLLACACGDGAPLSPQPGAGSPVGAPRLWLRLEEPKRSRIVLVTANGAIRGEWRTGEELDDETRAAVKAALDALVKPSHRVEIRVQKDVPFKTLKSLMLATGSMGARRDRVYVQVMAEFPPELLRAPN